MKKKLWNRDFVLLLQGNAISAIGDLMYSVAIGYWVYEQTGSSGLMGVMTSISMFITMFLSPFTGSIVDRCNRKWVLVCVDALQGVVMLGIGALAYMNALRVPVVLAAAVMASFGSVLYSPAVRTVMLDLIPKDDMVRGQSLHSGLLSLIDLVGTAFSGAMVAFFGVPLIVVINGISNLYSAFSELLVRVPRTVQQGQAVTVKGLFQDFGRALKTILATPGLRVFIPCSLIINFLAAGPLSLILPFCLAKGFTVDMYGYLLSAYTVGSLISVLLLGIVKLKPKARWWIMAVGFIFGVVLMFLAYGATEFLPMCIMAVGAAATNSAANSVFSATLMLALPEENRGAILGLMQSASVGGMALSTLCYGFLGDVFPLHIVFMVGTALSLVPMTYLCFHPKTREFMLEERE